MLNQIEATRSFCPVPSSVETCRYMPCQYTQEDKYRYQVGILRQINQRSLSQSNDSWVIVNK